jgi:hypothetical protein
MGHPARGQGSCRLDAGRVEQIFRSPEFVNVEG